MTGGVKGLILLSLCLVVWTVPIDRKQDPPQAEKPEENAVRLVSDQEHVRLSFSPVFTCTLV